MINVTQHYSRLDGVNVAIGEYDDNDPLLHGLGAFLVETGRAVRVVTVATDAPTPPQVNSVATTEALDIASAQHTPKTTRKPKGGG